MEQEGREEAARQRALAREREWMATSPQARQTKSKARIKAYDELVKSAADRRPGDAQIVIPSGERLGNDRHRRRGPQEGLWRPAADRRSVVQAAARRHRRRDRPERRRQDDAVPHDHRPGEARRRRRSASARPSTLGYVDQSRDSLDREQDRLGGNLRRQRHHQARQARDELAAPIVGAFNFKGGDQQQKVGTLSGGQRNRVHLAKMLKDGRQRPAARRADQRSRHRDAGGAGGRAGELRRLRRDHQPRPHVPRPPRHPHPRLRGRQPCRVVRGQFRGLRGGQDPPPRPGERSTRSG